MMTPLLKEEQHLKALVLLSHGSRLPESNQEMIDLANRLATFKSSVFSEVVCAFQQFAQPSFEAVVDDLASRNIGQIIVFPLFLSSGNHVRVDLPAMVQKASLRHPDLAITTTPHLGGLAGLDLFLMESIRLQVSTD